jgi:hypothetical protein
MIIRRQRLMTTIFRRLLRATAAAMLFSSSAAIAAVSPQEAEALKTTLTPMGAERAGNKDGTIPAWNGGYTTIPAGYKSGDPVIDPFASETPLFSITKANLDQYKDNLSVGMQEMLKKYPTFRIDVYPTHRTAAAPKWVYDNIFKNATNAKTVDQGLSFAGGFGGIPFPIPHDGHEVMLNQSYYWRGVAIYSPRSDYVVTASGDRVLASITKTWNQYPYYYPEGSVATYPGFGRWTKDRTIAPPQNYGEGLVGKLLLRNNDEQMYQYLPGQRRVRKAPNLMYDTPNFFMSGVGAFDEYEMFFGPMDQYQWKLIGKQEMFVPYNVAKFARAPAATVIGKHFIDPAYMRWERHRVWVVEATLAPHKRNVVAKRRFYVDEDSWIALVADEWDASGELWKVLHALPVVIPELPAVVGDSTVLYDLKAGTYGLNAVLNDMKPQYQIIDRLPEQSFSADELAAESVR